MTFEFLGFTHYCDRTRKTARKKFIQKMKEMNQWLKKARNLVELKEWWQVLRLKMLGHYRYYGISGNMPSMKVYYKSLKACP